MLHVALQIIPAEAVLSPQRETIADIHLVMPAPSVESMLKHYEFNLDLLQRVSIRKTPQKSHIVDPNPTWPQRFTLLESRLRSALGNNAISIAHVGSTSIPGMPAKDVIDIDICIRDPTDEASYVPALEAAGLQFLTREPHWYEHRFFCCDEPVANVHVFGPGCPELLRHRIFRDWIIKNAEDRALYRQTKLDAMEETRRTGGKIMDYNKRKEAVIRDILGRALRDAGYF